MFLLLCKKFFRSRIALIGLSVVLLAGIISIVIGRQHIQKQQNSIAQTRHFQQEHIERNARFFHKEIGLLLYYLRFSLANQPHPLNALSIGQRDVNNTIQSVTIRNLEGQKYDTDLFNPANLLTGNLDFSFVLIFLLPLLIISLTYNLLSEEKEDGTWKLVATQSRRPVKMLLQKMAIRILAVLAVLLILFLLAATALSLPLDSSFLATLLLSLLYVLTWFAICFWIVSLQRKSNTNAVALLSIWLLLTVVLPGAANNYITTRYPVPEAMATILEQREGYHAKWDMDKRTTMQPFYKHYPQFSHYGTSDTISSWLWYYAMQQAGDDEAHTQALQMQHKLWQRERASGWLASFIPTLHTQYQFNALARAGLGNHLQFLNSTTRFHERLRLHFYPAVFENAAVSAQNWKAFDMAYFAEQYHLSWWRLLLPLLLTIILFTILTSWQFSRFKTA